ncbi:hypothetical protein H0H93_003907 [Arthromyces matolae]|nr:hypothetical protein H0H93_003907 [Arthromyces matolae]
MPPLLNPTSYTPPPFLELGTAPMDTAKTAASRRLLSIQNHTNPLPQTNDGLVLVLPRGDKIFANSTTHAKGTLTHLRLNKTHIVDFIVLKDISLSFEVSSIGTRYEGAAHHIPTTNVFELSTPKESGIPKRIEIADFWATVYALFTLYRKHEHIPLVLVGVPNAEDLTHYLSISGLGRLSRGTNNGEIAKMVLFLSRAAFWQGAGTTGYHQQGWLLTPTPTFPSIEAFTRSDMVIASHPLRPPKPRPGEVLYRRYCAAIGKCLEFVAFDIGKPHSDGGLSRHMAAFHKWHNDERINSAWGERGSLETHRDYVNNVLADPGVLPIMMCWDGDLMGYVEIVWAKENHVAQYYPSGCVVGDWERGLHVLVGENKFLGASELWLRSLVHYIFLADYRTDRVVGEPKQSNIAILKATQAAGYHIQTVGFQYIYNDEANVREDLRFPIQEVGLVAEPKKQVFREFGSSVLIVLPRLRSDNSGEQSPKWTTMRRNMQSIIQNWKASQLSVAIDFDAAMLGPPKNGQPLCP